METFCNRCGPHEGSHISDCKSVASVDHHPMPNIQNLTVWFWWGSNSICVAPFFFQVKISIIHYSDKIQVWTLNQIRHGLPCMIWDNIQYIIKNVSWKMENVIELFIGKVILTHNSWLKKKNSWRWVKNPKPREPPSIIRSVLHHQVFMYLCILNFGVHFNNIISTTIWAIYHQYTICTI